MAEIDQDATAEQLPSYPETSIAIANLKLDEQNFRHDEVDSQRAAIKAIIFDQEFALVELAQHYLKHGLMPGERLIVVADDEDDGAYIVMEGNRRLTVMKLLTNPALGAETVVHASFVELSREFSVRRSRTVMPCVIFPDKASTLVWVGVKHSIGMGGVGVNQWGAPATARFQEFSTGKVSRWQAALRFLHEHQVDVSTIGEAIKRKTTAVNRVLNSGAMRTVLGIKFSQDGQVDFENGDVAAGCRLLDAMMRKMAELGFSTNLVHSFDDRLDFIERFSDNAVTFSGTKSHSDASRSPGDKVNAGSSTAGAGSEGDWSRRPTGDSAGSSHGTGGTHSNNGAAEDDTAENDSKSSSTNSTRGVRRQPRQRSTLASTRRGDEINILDDRLNQIYHEARKLKIERHTAVAAVIIRVFVELSCEYYLNKNSIPVPETIARRNNNRATNWHTFGIKFREKIEAVLGQLDPSTSLQELGDIRKGLGSQDHLTSPENLHDYVHGSKTIPAAPDLIIIWDRYYQMFMRIYA